jgi:hypothetical protein
LLPDEQSRTVSSSEKAAARAELLEDIRLPSDVKKLLHDLEEARAKESDARSQARKAAARAIKVLTEHLHLSRRDAAALTGYSFQRIHQLAHDGG